jgi:hypothetical protein
MHTHTLHPLPDSVRAATYMYVIVMCHHRLYIILLHSSLPAASTGSPNLQTLW